MSAVEAKSTSLLRSWKVNSCNLHKKTIRSLLNEKQIDKNEATIKWQQGAAVRRSSLPHHLIIKKKVLRNIESVLPVKTSWASEGGHRRSAKWEGWNEEGAGNCPRQDGRPDDANRKCGWRKQHASSRERQPTQPRTRDLQARLLVEKRNSWRRRWCGRRKIRRNSSFFL